MEIAELLVKLAADTAGFAKDLEGATKTATGWAKDVGGVVTKAIGGAVVIGGTAAVGAVAGIGVAAFKTADNVAQASRDIQAELGLTEEEAERLGDVALEVWGDNFTGSVEEAAEVVSLVRQQLGDMTNDELKDVTEGVAMLSDVFGIDAAESVDAVKALMEDMGLSSEEALDFISKGMQDGLNSSDDFLDSITEYAPQFKTAGFDAGGFYSVMKTGSKAGVLGTDKISDAIKEMSLKLGEGGEELDEVFNNMGLNFTDISESVASGETTWADYFDEIVGGINDIEDPIERRAAQVAVFGTMAEDLGDSFTDGLTSAAVSVEDLGGATDSLETKYGGLGDFFEGVKRRLLVAIEPIGEKLMDLAEKVMPLVETALGWFEDHLAPAIETIADKFGEFIENFVSRLEEGESPLEAIRGALEKFLPPDIMEKVGGFLEIVQNVIDTIITFVQDHSEAFKAALMAIGAVLVGAAIVSGILSIAGAIAAIANPVTLIIGAIALLAAAWAEDWGGIRTKLTEVWEKIEPIFNTVKDWLEKNIPIALEALRAWWEDKAWPAIQKALEAAEKIITPIWEAFKDWLENTLPDALETLREWWEDKAWPAIQKALEAAKAIIEPIWENFKVWLEETIPNALETLRSWWEDIVWPAIQAALELAESIITPIWEGFKTWMETTLPAALETIRHIWEDVIWPAIQAALELAESIITPIWEGFKTWMEVTLPAALEIIRHVWEDVVWPALQEAIETVEDIIVPIWEAFKKWFEETIPDALETLRALWQDVVWPAIQKAVEDAWDKIEKIWKSIQDWYQNIIADIESARDKFETAWESIKGAVSDAWDKISGWFDAIKDFWNWLKEHIFNISITLSGPDEIELDSPRVKLHNALKRFERYLGQADLSIPLSVPDIPTATAMMTATQATGAAEQQQQQVWNIETLTVIASDPMELAEQLAAMQSPY